MNNYGGGGGGGVFANNVPIILKADNGDVARQGALVFDNHADAEEALGGQLDDMNVA